MSPNLSRNVHVPRQRAASLTGSSEYHYARRHREHRSSRLRIYAASLAVPLPAPSFSQRQELFKQSYLRHGQDNSYAIHRRTVYRVL